MRILTAALLLGVAACAGASTGPAWPKSAGSMVPEDWRDDGGESLTPHLVAEVEESSSDDDEAIESEESEEVEEAPEPKASDEKPAEEKPAEAPTEEIILEEEIIIEVE